MSSPPINFSDYHRTVIGYHGTTIEAAARLVDGDDFAPSDQDDEWFGRGIYFWEHAYQQAWWWAKRRGAESPAVVGAVIRLGMLRLARHGQHRHFTRIPREIGS